MPLSTGAASGFEQAVLEEQKRLANQAGDKSRIITGPEIEALALKYFGEIPVPEGVEIIRRTPIEVVYRTPDGREIFLRRNLDQALRNDIGRIETQHLNAPAPVAGNPQQNAAGQNLINDLISQTHTRATSGRSDFLDRLSGVADRLSQPTGLQDIDPTTRQALDFINQATQARLSQQFNDQSQSLVAQLFGSGVNRSSIAGEQSNRLLQGQGLVQAQAQADAAQRELAVRQFLSQLGQGNLAIAGDQLLGGANAELSRDRNLQEFLASLLNNQLQRDVANVGATNDNRRLDLAERSFLQDSNLARDQFELQAYQQRRNNRQQMIGSILGGALSLGTSLASGGLLKGLFGGSSNGAGNIGYGNMG